MEKKGSAEEARGSESQGGGKGHKHVKDFLLPRKKNVAQEEPAGPQVPARPPVTLLISSDDEKKTHR
jgi:hypothetical protein